LPERVPPYREEKCSFRFPEKPGFRVATSLLKNSEVLPPKKLKTEMQKPTREKVRPHSKKRQEKGKIFDLAELRDRLKSGTLKIHIIYLEENKSFGNTETNN